VPDAGCPHFLSCIGQYFVQEQIGWKPGCERSTFCILGAEFNTALFIGGPEDVLGKTAIKRGAAAVAEQGAKAGAREGGDHIVLGLEAFGLKQTAAKVGGRTVMYQGWQDVLRAAVRDPSTRFTLALDGLAGSTTKEKIAIALQKNAAGLPGATNWEIALLERSGRLADTNFVLKGKPVPNPFAP
jgi:hypothetical protein